jgi:hypothetical protein
MENLASSRDAQFHLDRRDSSELERYFVSCSWIEQFEARPGLTYFLIAISMVPVAWTSTRNGPSSCVCMAALPRR